MANTIRIKRSSTASAVPAAGDLVEGELAINTADKKLWSKDATTVFELANNATAVGNFGEIDQAETVTGLWNFAADTVGKFTDYDITVGDTADYGIMQIGSASLGRTSHTNTDSPAYNLDGAFIFRNPSGPVTGDIEFAFLDSSGLMRFGLPKSAVGNATYNPRSMIIAGPAVADSDVVTLSYWQGQGIFDNLTMDTGTNGADLGVQNDLEVEGDIFVDTLKESTAGADVSVLGSGFVVNEQANTQTSLYVGEASTLRGDAQDARVVIYGEQTGAITNGTITNTGSNLQFGGTVGSSQFTLNIDVLSGKFLRLRDGGNTDWVQMSHNGTDFVQTFTNTATWAISGATNAQITGGMDLYLRDAGLLRIYDSTDTDYADFSHDGDDFNLDLTNTLDFNITFVGTDKDIITNAKGFEIQNPQPSLWLMETDGTADNQNWRLYASGEQLKIQLASDAQTGGQDTLIIDRSATAVDTITVANGTNLTMTYGGDLTITDSTNADSVVFAHDGTYFNINATNTDAVRLQESFWIYGSGPNQLRIYDAGGTDYVAMSHDGTDFNIALTNTTQVDWQFGASRAVINLSSTNTSGPEYRLDAVTTDWRIGTAESSNSGNTLAAGDFFLFDATAAVMRLILTDDGILKNFNTVRIYDSLATDYVAMSHDGTAGYIDTNASGGDILLRPLGSSVIFGARDTHTWTNGPHYLGEEAAAKTDFANYGQIWVKNDTPCNLYYTDDTGQDVQITNNGAMVGGSFDNLTSKTGGTGDYLTTGDLGAGENSGGPALTINDGYGNSNLTFNHRNGTPDNTSATQSAYRIEATTDANSASMSFEMGDSTVQDTPVALTQWMLATLSAVDVQVNLDANAGLDVIGNLTQASGSVTFGGNVDADAGLDVTGNITVTGTVDGVDIANDVLLDTITGEYSSTYKRNIVQFNRWGAVQDMGGTSNWDEGIYGGFGAMTNGPTGMTYDPFLIMGSASDVRSFLVVPRTASRAIAYKGSSSSGASHTSWHYTGWTTTAASADLSLYTQNTVNEVISGTWDFDGMPQMTYGIGGDYSQAGGGTAFGATIWALDESWQGGAAGTDSANTSVYGIRWIRSTHANVSANIGEGLHGYINGSLFGGFGGSGMYTTGNFVAGGTGKFGASVSTDTSNTRAKLRIWNSDTYSIGMQNSFTFGGLGTDYAMTFQMSNTATRGFWWGDTSHGQGGGAMALTTDGKLTVAHSMRLGYGETDTTTPGASYVLDVSGGILASGPSLFSDSLIASDPSSNGFYAYDSVPLTLGIGADFKAYHDGTHTYFDSVLATAELRVRVKSTENAIICKPDAEVELYHNNQLIMETAGQGIEVRSNNSFSAEILLLNSAGTELISMKANTVTPSCSIDSEQNSAYLNITGKNASAAQRIMMQLDPDDYVRIYHPGANLQVLETDAEGVSIYEGALKLEQRTSAATDTTNFGQIWVTDANPQALYFTNDEGSDVQVTDSSYLIDQVRTYVKTADESVTSSTTYQDDNHMTSISLQANTWYRVEFHFDTNGLGGGLKFQWVFSQTLQDGGSQWGEWWTWLTAGSGANHFGGAMSSPITGITLSNSANNVVNGTGHFKTNATTGGTLKLQWAQQTSNATASTLGAGSHMTIQKMA